MITGRFTYFLFFILISISTSLKSQTFKGTGGRIPDTGIETVFTATVKGLPAKMDSTFGLEEICLSISHPLASDIVAFLESPAGVSVELTSVNGQGTSNYINTCFTNQAPTSVVASTGPFTGKYKPEGFLGRFNNGQNGNGVWKLIIKDWKAFSDSGSLKDWSLKFGKKPVKPLQFISSNLPIIIINTTQVPINDSVKTLVDMGIISNGQGHRNYITNSWNAYSGKALIEYRGASSQVFAKKSYGFKLVDNCGTTKDIPLLGLPQEHDWVLYAPYTDKSLMRNYITYQLALAMGNYASRSQFVEVVVNDQYQGVYLLMEKIKRDSKRVNISQLTPKDNFGDDITGGYIVKLDKVNGHGSGGWYSSVRANSPVNKTTFFQYEYPKDTVITIAQKNYIKSYIDSFELAVFDKNFNHPTKGYKKFIELNSFIDHFIINELSKNVDAYRLSTYLYKNKCSKGGKLCIGPVWDFDLAWHNAEFGNAFDPVGWQYTMSDSVYPIPLWWDRFMQDEDFIKQLHSRWGFLRETALSNANIFKIIDETAALLNEAQQRNFTVWPVLGTYVWPNPQPIAAEYSEEITNLKNWINNRLVWMDSQLFYQRKQN